MNAREKKSLAAKKMLEDAGNAARIIGETVELHEDEWALRVAPMSHDLPTYWNPIHNDADAFRLAVQLRFLIQIRATVTFIAGQEGNHLCSRAHNPHANDAYAATRYAIVRAAAEVWRRPITVDSTTMRPGATPPVEGQQA